MKQKLKGWSITKKILAGFLATIAIFMFLSISTYSSISSIHQDKIPLVLKNDKIAALILQMRKNEKDFFLRDVINEEFFETGRSDYIDSFNKDYEQLKELLNSLQNDEEVSKDNEITEHILQAETDLEEYHDKFLVVVETIKEKGFKDYGLVGELRKSVHNVEDQLEVYKEEKNLEILMLSARRAEKDYLLRKDLKYQEKLTGIISDFKTELNNTNLDQKSKDELSDLMDSYKTSFDKVVSLDQVIGFSADEGLLGEYRNAIHKLQPEIDDVHKHILDKTNQEVSTIKNTIMISSIVCIFFSLAFAIYLSRLITKPIRKTNVMLQDIAEGEGDLTKKLSIRTKDELGTLAGWFNLFINKLRGIIAEVKNNTDTLAYASEELSIAIEQSNQGIENISKEISVISDGLQNNASIVEEATASIEEMASGSTVVSEEAEKVADNSKNVLKSTQFGMEKLLATIKSIKKVEHSSNNIYSIIRQLNESSTKINEIVTIITNISEQTNLLALNAAIEAARVGEHGKGFAVVSDEIRKLAEESKTSAEEITGLLKRIEEDTEIAYSSMKEEQGYVRESVDQTEDTKHEFDKILDLIQQTVDQIGMISSASNQQSEIAKEISLAISEISQTTQNSAASTQQISSNIEEQVSTFEEIGASIEELSRMAQVLQGETDKFKVE